MNELDDLITWIEAQKEKLINKRTKALNSTHFSTFQGASLCNVRIEVLNEVLEFINELKEG